MLFRKMLRDMNAKKGQFISIFLMSFLAVFIYAGINSEWVGLNKILFDYYDETNMGNFWAYGEDFSQSDIDALKDSEDITDAEARLVVQGEAYLEDSPAVVLNIADTFNISGFKVIEGDEFEEGGEGIWLDRDFAQANDLSVGDTLTVTAYGIEIKQEIRALVISPEYIYSSASSELMVPDHKGNGFAFLTTASMPEGLTLPQNVIIINGEETDRTEAEIEDILDGRATEVIDRDSFTSHAVTYNEIEQHRAMGRVFPVAFLAIATLTIMTTMTRLVTSQRTQIGTLKALGYKKKKILLHYMSFGFWLSAVGAALGIVLGPIILAPIFFDVNRDYYVLPKWDTALSPAIFAMAAASVLVCTLATFLACRNTLKDVPAEALRPKAPAVFKAARWEKTKLWAKSGFNFQWNFRDVFRSRVRSIMVIVGVAGCGMLIMCAFGLYDSIENMISWQFEDIYAFETRITPKEGASTNALAEKYDAEKVYEEAVEIRRGDNKTSGTLQVTEGESDLIKYYDKHRRETRLPKEGVAISYKMAQTLNVGIGDTISWHIYGDAEWYDCEISAIYRTPLNQGIAMNLDTLEDMGAEAKVSYLVTNKNVSVDEEDIESIMLVSEMESDYMDILDLMYTMIFILVLAAIVLGVVVLYNLSVLTYTERERDMATLKVMGFKSTKLRKLLLSQNVWLTVIGALLAIPLAYLLVEFIGNTFTDEMDMMTVISWISILGGVFGTLIVSCVLSYGFSGKVKGVDMVSALKGTE